MDAATRNRIEAIGRSLNRRVLEPLSAWQNMLHALSRPQPEPGSRPDQILFLRLDARGGWPRDRCRPAPPLARPDHSVRGHAGGAGAGSAGHLGHAARRRRCRSGVRLGVGRGPGGRAAFAVAGDPRRRREPVRLRRADPRLRRHRRLRRRHRPARRRLSRAVPGLRRRRAWPVHRDPPAAGGACAHRARAGGGRHPALRPARRCDGQRDAGRHLPHRGGELPARHRRDARRRRCAGPRIASGGVREGALGAAGYSASRTAHPSLGGRSEGATTTASRGCGCARRSAD